MITIPKEVLMTWNIYIISTIQKILERVTFVRKWNDSTPILNTLRQGRSDYE